MNTQPNRGLYPVQIEEAEYMRERVYWQSRANLRDPPKLVDLVALAKAIHKTWQRAPWYMNFLPAGIKVGKQ